MAILINQIMLQTADMSLCKLFLLFFIGQTFLAHGQTDRFFLMLKDTSGSSGEGVIRKWETSGENWDYQKGKAIHLCQRVQEDIPFSKEAKKAIKKRKNPTSSQPHVKISKLRSFR